MIEKTLLANYRVNYWSLKENYLLKNTLLIPLPFTFDFNYGMQMISSSFIWTPNSNINEHNINKLFNKLTSTIFFLNKHNGLTKWVYTIV